MGRYTNLPTLLIDYLKPRRARFKMNGAAVDSGRNGIGESVSIEFSGGGLVSCAYEECFVQAPEEHEHANWIAARLDGSHRFINVPILTDWVGPFPLNAQGVPQPFVGGITHSDGSTFSDGAGYSQATVWGRFTAGAALGAGQISMRIYNASRGLRWSDWFSIYHEDVGSTAGKGWRSYRYWESEATGTGNETIDGVETPYRAYTLAITPPLRQAVEIDTRIEFARPRCVMKFPTGFTLESEIEGFWRSNPTLNFIEAF
jgi:hypothetical protein